MKHRVVTLLLAAAVCLGVIAAFIPVSYTHLDVYKRQDKMRP